MPFILIYHGPPTITKLEAFYVCFFDAHLAGFSHPIRKTLSDIFIIPKIGLRKKCKFYSYLKLSIGFNFAAFIAGITPDASPTTIATPTDKTTGHIENGTL